MKKNKILQYLTDPKSYIAFILAAIICNCWGLPFLLINTTWAKAIFAAYLTYMCIPFLNLTIPLGILLKRILFRRKEINDKENIN